MLVHLHNMNLIVCTENSGYDEVHLFHVGEGCTVFMYAQFISRDDNNA